MHGENMILLITMSFDDILECKTLEIFIMQPMLSSNNNTNNSNNKKKMSSAFFAESRFDINYEALSLSLTPFGSVEQVKNVKCSNVHYY